MILTCLLPILICLLTIPNVLPPILLSCPSYYTSSPDQFAPYACFVKCQTTRVREQEPKLVVLASGLYACDSDSHLLNP